MHHISCYLYTFKHKINPYLLFSNIMNKKTRLVRFINKSVQLKIVQKEKFYFTQPRIIQKFLQINKNLNDGVLFVKVCHKLT